jgi:hypothetical protein
MNDDDDEEEEEEEEEVDSNIRNRHFRWKSMLHYRGQRKNLNWQILSAGYSKEQQWDI